MRQLQVLQVLQVQRSLACRQPVALCDGVAAAGILNTPICLVG